jgi:hypothetical protein
MLAQALYPSQTLVYPNSGEKVEAAAAYKAWSALTVTPPLRPVPLSHG